MTDDERREALSPRELGYFIGTTAYHKLGFPVMRTLLTDGVKHLCDQGLTWLVTDSAIALEHRVPREEGSAFIKLKALDGGGAYLTIDDGGKGEAPRVIYHGQEYMMVDFPGLRENYPDGFEMFASQTELDGKRYWVMMLPSEY